MSRDNDQCIEIGLVRPAASHRPGAAVTVYTFGFVLVVALAALAATSWLASPAAARPEGLSGYSGNPDTGGQTCAVCHSANEPTPDVTISGPDSVEPGETAMFSVTVSDGPASVAGFNVSTSGNAGTLNPVGPGVRTAGAELTHNTPQPTTNFSATFTFSWTAPQTEGPVTMYAAGMSGDGDFTNGGDSTKGTSKVITVASDDPPVTEIPGADTAIEIAHAVSCLAGNGRVDTNVINTGSAMADYRIEFQGLTPRQASVVAGDWWRMPVTGRADGDYTIIVKRDGVEASNQTVTVSCDTAPPVIGDTEIQLVNACRAGNGYLIFQFLNASAASKSYIIEFEGVVNRSTTADAYGQAPRAVTGRPDGVYDVVVRSGLTPIASFVATVDCDSPQQ